MKMKLNGFEQVALGALIAWASMSSAQARPEFWCHDVSRILDDAREQANADQKKGLTSRAGDDLVDGLESANSVLASNRQGTFSAIAIRRGVSLANQLEVEAGKELNGPTTRVHFLMAYYDFIDQAIDQDHSDQGYNDGLMEFIQHELQFAIDTSAEAGSFGTAPLVAEGSLGVFKAVVGVIAESTSMDLRRSQHAPRYSCLILRLESLKYEMNSRDDEDEIVNQTIGKLKRVLEQTEDDHCNCRQ